VYHGAAGRLAGAGGGRGSKPGYTRPWTTPGGEICLGAGIGAATAPRSCALRCGCGLRCRCPCPCGRLDRGLQPVGVSLTRAGTPHPQR